MSGLINFFTDVEILMLVLLFVNNAEAIKGRLWLQKIMYLITKNIDEIQDIFDGYYIGPFSEDVEIALEQFIGSNYIEISNNYKISLTEYGINTVKEIINSVPEEKLELVKDMKTFLNDMTRDELIAFIYSTFPESAKESDIKEQFENNRYEASISLLKKNKVSLEKASEIAGYPLSEYIKKIKQKSSLR